MAERKRKIPRNKSIPPMITTNRATLPQNVIYLLNKSMEFEVFRNGEHLVRPENDESGDIRTICLESSTKRTLISFINGKKIGIEYSYNAWRRGGDPLLINIDTLLPVFGGVMPPATDQFVSISKLENFVKMHVHLDECSKRQHIECLCNQEKHGLQNHRINMTPSIDTCKHDHFHHYCDQHLLYWMKFFLRPVVIACETNSCPTATAAAGFLEFLDKTIRF